jgi:hypothetical protein
MKVFKNGDSYYRMIKPVGSWSRQGCQHYALWRPVRKLLWFFVRIRSKEDFWLDTEGFQPIR